MNPFGNPENVNVFGLTSPFGRGVAEGDGEGSRYSHALSVTASPCQLSQRESQEGTANRRLSLCQRWNILYFPLTSLFFPTIIVVIPPY